MRLGLSLKFRFIEVRPKAIPSYSSSSLIVSVPGNYFSIILIDFLNYTKSYPGMDSGTRNEDLLRKFLNCLASEHAQFHVEFTENHEYLDEAISEVVNRNSLEKKERGQTANTFVSEVQS